MTTTSTDHFTLTPAPPTSFNAFAPDLIRNPYPTYTRLLAQEPFFDPATQYWVFTRYADVRQVLRDPVFSRRGFGDRLEVALGAGPLSISLSQWMLFRDPPDHTRLRGLVSQAFTPASVAVMRAQIQATVDALLENGVAGGALDIIQDLAYPLPVLVICALLGVPPSDRECFGTWSAALAHSLDAISNPLPELVERGNAAADALTAYFRNLVRERRTHPGNDLLSSLIAAQAGDDRLADDELLATCVMLFFAGHETTVNLIGNGMLALLRNAPQWSLLQHEPALIANAVEELLRFESPVQRTGRIADRDVELGALHLEAGERVFAFIGAANRDPRQFSRPDRLDVRRTNSQQHLSFGGGMHYCLGAALARLEAQVAIATLVRWMEAPHLADLKPEWRPTFTLRGLRSLRVSFTPKLRKSQP